MSEPVKFRTMAVVSTVTGILMCDIIEIYEVLDYMFDKAHYTHQLPDAADEASLHIIAQHPWIGELNLVAGGDMAALRLACTEIESRHGLTLALAPVPNLEEIA